jgi:aminopeptidase YwaD
MKRALFACAAVAAALAAAPAVARAGTLEPAEAQIDAEGALEKVKALADDAMEGRGVGTAGGRKAGEWIAARLRAIGLAPEFRPFEVDGVKARNIVVVIRGRDAAAGDEHVVVGAHYDHVGRGEAGNGIDFFGGRGEIHNGADDNASGSAALLEVAEALARYGPARRSIVLVWFDGEERGLWGSQAYVEHPVLPLATCIAMLNMDMVGRLRGREVEVIGASSGEGLPGLIAAQDEAVGLAARFDPYMVPNSDHFSFYAKQVPVAFFCTGLHGDYHRTSDDWPRIDADGIAAIARVAFRAAVALAEGRERVAFADVPMAPLGAIALEYLEGITGWEGFERAQRELYGAVRGMFVRAQAAGGLRVDYVEPGSPAARAGVKKGDRIERANGTEVRGLLGRLKLLALEKEAARAGGGDLDLEVRRAGAKEVVRVKIPLTRPPRRDRRYF